MKTKASPRKQASASTAKELDHLLPKVSSFEITQKLTPLKLPTSKAGVMSSTESKVIKILDGSETRKLATMAIDHAFGTISRFLYDNRGKKVGDVRLGGDIKTRYLPEFQPGRIFSSSE